MRHPWVWLRWLGAGLLVAGGCVTRAPNLKPPPHPEEYNLPPQGDKRFDEPAAFPAGTPKSSDKHKDKDKDTNPLGDPSHFRNGRQGMGAY